MPFLVLWFWLNCKPSHVQQTTSFTPVYVSVPAKRQKGKDHLRQVARDAPGVFWNGCQQEGSNYIPQKTESRWSPVVMSVNALIKPLIWPYRPSSYVTCVILFPAPKTPLLIVWACVFVGYSQSPATAEQRASLHYLQPSCPSRISAGLLWQRQGGMWNCLLRSCFLSLWGFYSWTVAYLHSITSYRKFS